MKNAQLFSQPFFYIFILIVAVLTLSFGFYIIKNTLNLGQTIEFSAFRNNLQKEITTFYYLTKGSTKSLLLKAPQDLNYVCFTNINSDFNKPFPTQYTEILIESKPDYNTFFISYPNKKPLDPSYMNISYIILEDNPLCIKTINKLEIKVENTGNNVLIKNV